MGDHGRIQCQMGTSSMEVSVGKKHLKIVSNDDYTLVN
jgi:hypothetical protein